MDYRKLGKTDWLISEISLGTWQVGGGWGKTFDPKVAYKIIHTAIDQGINFIDTADVYDGGLSETAVGKVIRESREEVFVASKCGRQINPHVSAGYTAEALRGFVEGSLRRMGLETIDLIQLHCPPTAVYQRDEIFELFEQLKKEGKIRHMGVSVEKVEEAMLAMKYEIVSTVQIIFNMFRLKPSEKFFSQAAVNNVGVIVRVPLASGLLTGKFTSNSVFDTEDHRAFNREGAVFDKGETFSGVPFEKGLAAVEELKEIFEGNETLAATALRWILMFPEVSTLIPGASKVEQVLSNVMSGNFPPIPVEKMEEVRKVYDKNIRGEVHQQW